MFYYLSVVTLASVIAIVVFDGLIFYPVQTNPAVINNDAIIADSYKPLINNNLLCPILYDMMNSETSRSSFILTNNFTDEQLSEITAKYMRHLYTPTNYPYSYKTRRNSGNMDKVTAEAIYKYVCKHSNNHNRRSSSRSKTFAGVTTSIMLTHMIFDVL